jgi:hypothetical protein
MFDLGAVQALDTADMQVRHPVTDELTGWTITFAGPGHPQAQEQSERATRQRLSEERQQREALRQGRKWSGGEKTPDDLRAENVAVVADRVIGWSPISLNGTEQPFSRENATRILGDSHYGWLYKQCLDFLAADGSFLPRSATSS